MSDPYVGEIKMVSWNSPPENWALCDGATLPIASNQALFALLGTTYGGDGITHFKVPDLRARVPIGACPALRIGSVLGEPTHTLTVAEMPFHTHRLPATSTAGTAASVSPGEWLGAFPNGYGPRGGQGPALSTLDAADVAATGANQPHENRQPYLCVNFIISLAGIFPTRD